jgi:hypothetical protein
MRKQPLLVIIIVENDVDWRCTSSHLARWWSWSKLLCLLIEKCFQVLGTVALQLPNDLYCLLILLLPEFHFFSSGVQFLGEHSGMLLRQNPWCCLPSLHGHSFAPSPTLGQNGMSWGDGYIDLLDLKNSSERLRGWNVDLNMPLVFRALIHHLSLVILRLLVVS